ncbi:rRNA-processing protein UTP23 homolog isoform X2 [Hermetia illucens]|uniref:rRNA-processing protein UTP23 homolog isoform X2 n=1 Tax=Hermetia illucens TaxID=343691 RepID=UPI0018CC1730|nr:rRNA-processing protein UTP23 homolog isoform X2 [Hermetia illucens]
MKILRNKKASKLLAYYATNFGYKQPYQVLVDATFCQAALQNKVAVEDQLKKYLQTDLRCFTTQCIILEAEHLGQPLIGATRIVKQFSVFKCGHEGKPIGGSDCVRDMVKIPGQALLYLHRSAPVLEPPSKKTKDIASQKISSLLTKAQKTLRKDPVHTDILTNKKRKKPKNPNPLSCKKKKIVKNGKV